MMSLLLGTMHKFLLGVSALGRKILLCPSMIRYTFKNLILNLIIYVYTDTLAHLQNPPTK